MVLLIRIGSFHAEPPPPKQRIERQRKAPNKEAKRIMPTQVVGLNTSPAAFNHMKVTARGVSSVSDN